jgi:hypothetical protein
MADNTEGNLALFQKLTSKNAPEEKRGRGRPKKEQDTEPETEREHKQDPWLSVYNDFLFKDL